eukprot:tig00000137_g8133.t1
MLTAQRRELHLAAGRWLEMRSKGDGHDLAALTMHYRLGGLPEKALKYLARAAEHAMSTNALAEAARLNAEVISAIDELGLAGPDVPPVPRAAKAESDEAPPSARRPGDPVASPTSPDKHAAWAIARGCALRSWAMVRYYEGHFRVAFELAAASLATLGEPLPEHGDSVFVLARIVLRIIRLSANVDGKFSRASATIAPPPTSPIATSTLRCRREAIFDSSLVVLWSLPTFPTCVPAYEISRDTPDALLGVDDVRVRGNFASVVDAVGSAARGRAMLVRAEALGDRLKVGVDEIAKASLCNQRGMQLCREGRFEDAIDIWKQAFFLIGNHPSSRSLVNRVSYALNLLLTGNFAASERVCEEAAVFNSRLGLSESFMSACFAQKCLSAILQGRLEEAVTLLKRSQEVLAWRLGDSVAALRFFERAAELQAEEMRTVTWNAIPRTNGPVGFWARIFGGNGATVGISHNLLRLNEGLPLELLDVKRAEAFAKRVARLLSEARRRRLPALAPFVDLAAAHLGRPARRLARLRAAREGLARAGLRPWEAAASLQLSLWTDNGAEAAEAAASAARIAGETGLRIPSAATAVAGGDPSRSSPANVVSLWV